MLTDTIELDADASDEIRRCAEEMNLPAEGMALILATARAEAETEPANEAYARFLAEIGARTDLSPVDRDALLVALDYFGQFVTTLPIMTVDQSWMTDTGGEGIYIASKAIHGPRWRELRASGVPIISTWIDEAEVGLTNDWSDLWVRSAKEAAAARALILFRLPEEQHAGALIEAGCAIRQGRPVFAVGWDHASFRHHPLVRAVDTLEEALDLALAV
ncbi:conserved hypothetical protein [Hyphomicrobiales bacterium]|nr:conserved hypothetical protein [Hyphomicrobiales bacterium]CAH1702975.1 hypothetical protein BOSEA1005_30847 [Hyphomicrobiales bacterium]CAI0347161.1 conserved hypothetical protein [Hyphomicrobiales bacterium]